MGQMVAVHTYNSNTGDRYTGRLRLACATRDCLSKKLCSEKLLKANTSYKP